jgi:V/A-type H+-transporting ATPase subunit B
MKDGIGEGKTRSDHSEVANQLYDAYSRSQEVRALAEIVGRAGLTGIDLKYLDTGDMFENNFLKQNLDENRSLEETLSRAWDILSALPESELTKIKDKHIKQYYRQGNQQQSTNVEVAAAVSSSRNAT